MSATPVPKPPGAFAPLRHGVFTVLWVATILGNSGTFMRDVASSWLVADMSASPAAVALVQAAGSLPIFLLAIPAGVLSDILDRRRLLIAIQVALTAVSALLMLLAATNELTVEILISLTFVGGIGAALMGPTWQSIVPELVPRADLRSAVALNSLGFNIARSIGPAVGGLLLASFGAALTYGADVASYLLVIAALVWWRRAPKTDDALQEQFGGALRAGLRYARASRELHVVLLRAVVFFAFASAVWALLPLIARNLLGGDAGFYGLLLAAVGVGAIAGALVLPAVRARLDGDGLLLAAALIAAGSMAILALGPPQWLAIVVLLILGAGWIAALTTINGTVQAILPNWVRGRGLAIYLTVFNGAMAAGSILWGAVADGVGVPVTLYIAGGGLTLLALAAHRFKLPGGEADLTPSNHWPEPLVATPIEGDRGPVLVTIEYLVDQAQRPAFLKVLHRLSAERRRDGAYSWGLTEDAEDATRIVEWFLVESWIEHLRQHARVSKADADLQGEARRFHTGDQPPVVRHLLGITARR
ncbi:MFS transporter [Oleomonas cavernae]|uniref:MFS transporter n=1 Tax=Oleomonas cavernae TaxID=2320859 RepID=A0A418WG72_9PROT|nr:MFS transporter [Oleomonas cavernae]RJF88909.1 MFS transporter [Oleomonas cavernae]